MAMVRGRYPTCTATVSGCNLHVDCRQRSKAITSGLRPILNERLTI